MSAVRIRGREVPAHIQPIRSGFFLRASDNAASGVRPGAILEVDGRACVVRYLIAGDPCDPEVWEILLPVRKAESGEACASV
jgi:hypothetical protein